MVMWGVNMNKEIELLLTFKIKNELNNSYVNIKMVNDCIDVYIRRKNIDDMFDSLTFEYRKKYDLETFETDILSGNLSYIANTILYDYKKYISSFFFKGAR